MDLELLFQTAIFVVGNCSFSSRKRLFHALAIPNNSGAYWMREPASRTLQKRGAVLAWLEERPKEWNVITSVLSKRGHPLEHGAKYGRVLKLCPSVLSTENVLPRHEIPASCSTIRVRTFAKFAKVVAGVGGFLCANVDFPCRCFVCSCLHFLEIRTAIFRFFDFSISIFPFFNFEIIIGRRTPFLRTGRDKIKVYNFAKTHGEARQKCAKIRYFPAQEKR